MTGKVDHFITFLACSGWVDSGQVAAALVDGGYVHDEDNAGEEDDFDTLLAASSFGSEQARAIREQTPTAVREHARRVLDGKEKCAPTDVDDAVGGLVYGLAHGVVPGPALLILASSTLTPGDLLTACSGRDQADLKLVIFACQTSVLWPDHRARLLQALIDHDAFASLRHDVAWKIIDWTFDVPRPPSVLRECAARAVAQVDVAALARTWFASDVEQTAARTCDPGLSRSTPALDSAPPRRALTAGPTRLAIAAPIDTPAKTWHSPRQTRAHPRRLPGRRRPSTIAAGKHRHVATPSVRRLVIIAATAAAVVVAAVGLFLGALRPGIGKSHLAGDQGNLRPVTSASTPTHFFSSSVLFEPDSATLESGGVAVLKTVAWQTQSQDLAVSVTAYASPVGGTAANNLTLSVRRAEIVRDWLIKLGVPAAQITHVDGVYAPVPDLQALCQGKNALCQKDKTEDATSPELRTAIISLSPAIKNP